MREHRILVLIIATAALAAVGVPACSDPVETGDDPNPDQGPAPNNDPNNTRQALLANIGQNVILSLYSDFATSAQALSDATEAYAGSLSDEDHQAAQQAWRDAVDLWQQAEVFQVGPAGIMGEVAGGEDLRDEIYSWPLVNRCRVDQEIVEGNFSGVEAFAAEPINVRGLDALEYLLFNTTEENGCEPNSRINRDGEWDAISAELQQRRADYAHTLALLLGQKAGALRDAWDPVSGDFVSDLATPGGTYGSIQEALNALSDAMFYVETEVKDMKLAIPAGLSDCDEGTCPDTRESPFANRSKEHILANLRAFQRAFLGSEPGGEGVGFDDLLIEVGAEELAQTMTSDLEAAIVATEAIEGSLVEALGTKPQTVVAAYDAIQKLMTHLKTQFVSVLDLELPQRAEGDND